MPANIDQHLLQLGYDLGIYAFMNSKWAWPAVESLHFICVCLLIGTVGVFDLRLLGFCKGLSFSALHKFIPIGITGFFLNVITGTLFFLAAPGQYLYNPAFQTKMTFMACAGINMVLFYVTTSSTVKNTASDTDVVSRAKLIGFVSLTCWVGVITCGRLITFFRPPYFWCFWC